MAAAIVRLSQRRPGRRGESRRSIVKVPGQARLRELSGFAAHCRGTAALLHCCFKRHLPIVFEEVFSADEKADRAVLCAAIRCGRDAVKTG